MAGWVWHGRSTTTVECVRSHGGCITVGVAGWVWHRGSISVCAMRNDGCGTMGVIGTVAHCEV